MTNTNKNLAIILCAAGQSRRLGQAKQLLKVADKSLLAWQVDKIVDLSTAVYVVLGFKADEMSQTLAQQQVNLLINKHWSLGLGSSIACAVKQLPNNVDAVLLLQVDQYLLTNTKLSQFIDFWRKQPEKIAICQYHKQQGPPVIFPKTYFNELVALTEQPGAKSVIKKNSDNVVTFSLPEAFTDIDTPLQLLAFEEFVNQQI